MSLDTTVAILGVGAIGGALADGLLKAGALKPEQLLAADRSPERAAEISSKLGINVNVESNAEPASKADVVVLAVKPPLVAPVLEEISDVIRPGKILVSVAAAVPLSKIESRLKGPLPVFRAMPNIAMTVHESATAVCCNEHAEKKHRELVGRIFRTVGTVSFVPEQMMHAVTGLSGSGPAYVCLIIEALVAGGIQMGLPVNVATQLAQQTVLGAAKLARETRTHPAELRDRVTTPGGTTVAGLAQMEKAGVRAALAAAVEAATKRSQELAQDL